MSDLAVIIIVGLVLTALCYIIINQMLMLNAMAKRSMEMTESVFASLDRAIPLIPEPTTDKKETDSDHFDPHAFSSEVDE